MNSRRIDLSYTFTFELLSRWIQKYKTDINKARVVEIGFNMETLMQSDQFWKVDHSQVNNMSQ